MISAFNLQEQRPELIRMIKALQPGASNRAIAEAIGVGGTTVRRDTAGAPNGAAEPEAERRRREPARQGGAGTAAGEGVEA